MKLKFNSRVVLVKSIVTGLAFGFLMWLVGLLTKSASNSGLAWMAYVVMILSGVALMWAMVFRNGTENLIDGMVSMLFVLGVWGIVGMIIGFNPLSGFVVNLSLTEVVTLLAVFWTAEGITQRLMKKSRMI